MQGEANSQAKRADSPDKDEIKRRKEAIKDTLCCPYCGERLKKWEVPQTVFTQWPNEFFYVCMNDDCSYFNRGWYTMASQGNPCSYRLMYDPLTDSCNPIPVFNKETLRDGIIEDE
jgi:hypothetical protein